jgi:hypothetical protein
MAFRLILRFQPLTGLIVPDPHLDQEKYLIRKGLAGADYGLWWLLNNYAQYLSGL